MKDLKFRVWYSDENRYLETPNGLFFKYPHNELGEYIGDFISEPYIVEQFTGIKDRKDKQIFEGDIVLIPENDPESSAVNALNLVVYEGSCWCYKDLDTGKVESIYDFIGLSDKDEEAEVIGNQFENPELCKI